MVTEEILKNAVTEKLFWEKYRPTSIQNIMNPLDEAILLPRIKPILEKGMELNLIFKGSPGVGKSSLARIMAKDYDYMIINASKETSIDVLRNKVTEFCNTMSFMSDKDIKIVIFEEFDGVSSAFQDALKSFIEDYEHAIRFIITTNVERKINDAIKSRFKIIDFDPLNGEEQKWLMTQYAKRATLIANAENIELTKEQIVNTVKSYFPDMRSIMNELQYLNLNPNASKSNQLDDNMKNQLFNMIFQELQADTTRTNYDWIFTNLDSESKLDLSFYYLGRDFIKKCNELNISSDKICKLSYIHTDITSKRKDAIDPWIVFLTLVYKYQIVLNEK